MSAIPMQPFMGQDLAGVFTYDMPTQVQVAGKVYSILKKDATFEEIDALGGPEIINALELHFLASQLPSIVNGSMVSYPVNGRQREVLKSTLSEDGNELIVYVRAS
jgi:hypothetical protein